MPPCNWQPSSTPEEWRPVRGWETKYLVSSLGRVLTSSTGLIRTGREREGRRVLISLGHDDVRKVAHMVLEAFVGPRPEGQEALHYDDDHTNNSLENLRWGTRSENLHDAVRNGRHPYGGKTHCTKGHEYTPENTHYKKDGRGRDCLQCARDRARRRRP
ncbi:HNH endonuclease [Mycobacterium phage ScoobyDoobyDoo]|nr:HNH endonuclease [Mycobacterium phage ScoobyDoobyDoo]